MVPTVEVVVAMVATDVLLLVQVPFAIVADKVPGVPVQILEEPVRTGA